MAKETKNAALTTAQAFHHQSIVALDKCFEMQEGDAIYIEKDGDVSLANDENMGKQLEVKDVIAPLTDHHASFWNTLKNWLAAGFNHKQYKQLILHTTQSFGKTTKLRDWNSSSSQSKLHILHEIVSSNNFDSQIAEVQQNIMKIDESFLLEVIEKITLCTDSENTDEILDRIKRDKLSGIPDNNQTALLENLIGFIYCQGDKDHWTISFLIFREKFIDLTAYFARKDYTFPPFSGKKATTQEIAQNESKSFVAKIKDIDYEEVLPEAIGNWLEFTQSLTEDLDKSPVYREKTKAYQNQLIDQYNTKYRRARRNSQNSQDLYDDITGSTPLPMDNQTPHIAYRNGVMHDAMDSEDYNLKWNTCE